MTDLSLHIMDIIENSVSAKATEINVLIEVIVVENKLRINISDNGIGLDEELVEMVQDPFYTTKIHRKKKVGLGLPLFKQSVEMSGGKFLMKSELNKGTEIDAIYKLDHIDRMPLGNLQDTFTSLVIGHAEVDFELKLRRLFLDDSDKNFHFSTKLIKEELGDIPLSYPDVMLYIQKTIEEGIKKIELEEI